MSIKWDDDQLHVLCDQDYKGVVFIDSVPGCGKTTVLTDMTRSLHDGNTLIISLTNSVREGTSQMVRTMLKRAHESYLYKNVGNHNVFSRKNISGIESCIHVATLDSWVHDSLAELDSLEDLGSDDYTGKRVRLLSCLRQGLIPKQSFMDYKQIAVDEVQDLDEHFFQILLKLATLCTTDRRLLLVGDRYQNVFGKAQECIMERIELHGNSGLLPNYRSYSLRYNHRCPPAHLKFINKAFGNYGRSIRWPDDKPDGEKPIVMQLPRGRSKAIIHRQAQCIMGMIDKCLSDGYTLSDIVVLSPITSVNRIYGELEMALKRKYGWTGHQKVAWLYNDAGSGDGSVDWQAAKGKIILSSIHANKGRTHRVVIACDFTDGILPKHHANQDIQIKAQVSQALVALSRATERLIIPYAPPMSRFLADGFSSVEEMFHYCTYMVHDKITKVEPFQKDLQKTIEKTTAPSTVIQLASAMSTSVPFDIECSEPVLFGKQSMEIEDVQSESSNSNDDTNDDCPMNNTSQSLLPPIMHNEHLTPVFGYFGQLALYNKIGLGLPGRLTAYLNPIITTSYSIAKKYSWEREKWIGHISNNDIEDTFSYWKQVIEEQMQELNPDGSPNLFRMTIREATEALRVGNLVSQGGGPEHCVILQDKIATQPVIQRIVDSIKCYNSSVSTGNGQVHRMTLWNLAVAMCGLNNGIFESRPWLSTLIDNPIIDLNHDCLNRVLDNCDRFGSTLRGHVTDFEISIKTNIDGFPLQGRLDLCLDDGTIIDVKCPTTKEPRVHHKDWTQLGLYAAMLHRLGNQNVTGRIAVLNLSHGVYNKGLITSDLNDLLSSSAALLRDRGYVPIGYVPVNVPQTIND